MRLFSLLSIHSLLGCLDPTHRHLVWNQQHRLPEVQAETHKPLQVLKKPTKRRSSQLRRG